MSVGDVAAALHRVLARLVLARKGLSAAADRVGDAGRVLAPVVRGTADPELAGIPRSHARVAEDLRATVAVVAEVERMITAYLASIGATGSDEARPVGAARSGSADKTTAQASARSSGPLDRVTNRHGDRYPEEALPESDELPPRVRRGEYNVPIIGFVQLDGRDVGTLTSDKRDDWAAGSWQRLAALRFPRQARGLFNHVEMKAVVLMVRARAHHARVVINHAPCGSEPGDPAGCDGVLAEFLPLGTSMTVLGTDKRGDPFRRTYTGKAST